MRISLITLQYILNYGSVLQTYATQEKLRQMGHEVEVVNYTRENCRFRYAKKRELITNQRWNKNYLTRILFTLKWNSMRLMQSFAFYPFVKKHINQTRKYRFREELILEPPQADIYCTGSDQTWNSKYNGGIAPEYYLEYAPPGKKRIALAASFGRECLGQDERLCTAPWIQKYAAISTREQSGVHILAEMGYETGVCVLDPTLMLTSRDWEILCKKNKRKKKYVLIYQLDNRNIDLSRFAKKISEDLSIDLIRITTSPKSIFMEGKQALFPKIEVFLTLFRDAEYVVTDSFHGTAFSLNFGRQVFVFYPKQFSERLHSILSTVDSLYRVVVDSTVDWKTIPPIDYKMTNRILDEERNKATQFIFENFN